MELFIQKLEIIDFVKGTKCLEERMKHKLRDTFKMFYLYSFSTTFANSLEERPKTAKSKAVKTRVHICLITYDLFLLFCIRGTVQEYLNNFLSSRNYGI